jgi:WD40 repeat protein
VTLGSKIDGGEPLLPSVAFFTMLHTHESLNCVAIRYIQVAQAIAHLSFFNRVWSKHSDEGAWVAGGFSDSSIKLWDVTAQEYRDEQQQQQQQQQRASAADANNNVVVVSDGKQSTTTTTTTTAAAATADDANVGASFRKLIGHAGPVYALSFSVDSKVCFALYFVVCVCECESELIDNVRRRRRRRRLCLIVCSGCCRRAKI